MNAPGAEGEFFQLGYVTCDIACAKALWTEQFGVPGFIEIDTRAMAPPGSPGPFIKFALGYRGSMMIELIQPDTTNPGIYGDALRTDGGTMLHHLGFLLPADRFDAVEAGYVAQGTPVPVTMRGDMTLLYADTRAGSGLFTEVVVLTATMQAMFESIPR
jgi:hypothetical protein